MGAEASEAQVDLAWDTEARTFEKLRELNHANIIPCLAAIQKSHNRYFMFPWADGNLREFWTNYRGPRNPEIIEQTVNQLYGLADALDKLHNYNTYLSQNATLNAGSYSTLAPPKHAPFENIRHGDLKPENILRFAEHDLDLGTLKIGDMGLAQHHLMDTYSRAAQSATSYGTVRYRAPESFVKELDQPRSRLEDVWAMGCITLEFIVWILRGNEGLEDFNKSIQWQQQPLWDSMQLSPYFEIAYDGGLPGAILHSEVQRWIEEVLPQDPGCQPGSAVGDLLSIVKNKLLVLDYQPPEGCLRPAAFTPTNQDLVTVDNHTSSPQTTPISPDSNTPCIRATAREFRDDIQEIRDRIRQDRRYLLASTDKIGQPPPPPQTLDSPPSSTTTAGIRASESSQQSDAHGEHRKEDGETPKPVRQDGFDLGTPLRIRRGGHGGWAVMRKIQKGWRQKISEMMTSWFRR